MRAFIESDLFDNYVPFDNILLRFICLICSQKYGLDLG